jgi:hypothetical protein
VPREVDWLGGKNWINIGLDAAWVGLKIALNQKFIGLDMVWNGYILNWRLAGTNIRKRDGG